MTILLIATDCHWGSWQEGQCDKTCGEGLRRDDRNKLVEEQNGGSCDGLSYRIENCNDKKCPGE